MRASNWLLALRIGWVLYYLHKWYKNHWSCCVDGLFRVREHSYLLHSVKQAMRLRFIFFFFVNFISRIQATPKSTIPLSSVKLTAPVTGIDKVLCVGLNYKDHCKEQKLTPPPVPIVFSKFASSIIGTGEPLRLRTEVTDVCDFYFSFFGG